MKKLMLVMLFAKTLSYVAGDAPWCTVDASSNWSCFYYSPAMARLACQSLYDCSVYPNPN